MAKGALVRVLNRANAARWGEMPAIPVRADGGAGWLRTRNARESEVRAHFFLERDAQLTNT